MPILRELVARCLLEDLGRGDVTTDACVPGETQGQATMTAREGLIFCGLPVVEEIFAQLDPTVQVKQLCAEGEPLVPQQAALLIEGPARSILKGERLSLNFVQRMSGIATLTRSYVDAMVPGTQTRVTDTRKTAPGLRVVERYAVRRGGGYNHRADLGSAILIKDNHVAAAGGVTSALHRARAVASHVSRITCEVDTMDQLHEALAAGADIVILDNFSVAEIVDAVALIRGRAIIEVSGAVTMDRMREISSAGVNVVSVGALTHSARAVDLGLDWAV